MSWASRLGNLGRFSPFAREPPKGPSTVSEADFSYITSDDLRRFDAEAGGQHNDDLGPARDTDVLQLKNNGTTYQVHFPAYSIGKGEVTIGQIRDHAARKIGISNPQRIKLVSKGKTLADDKRTSRQENLSHNAAILCIASEGQGSDDDEEDDDGEYDSPAQDGESTKKKRNRGKKTKRRNKRETQDAPPRPAVAAPTTPLGKLDALRVVLETFIPQCQAFEASPPADPAKRSYEHKRLSETILTQVLLKIDAVETDGDAEARARRKELVRETQELLSGLDAVVKG
ncbi:uncharacterized protein K489DRAFT_349397 [Dissoconium aciculare CBS 342.82]|uniref:BAG domain-containing protein n=1 Tax=Dissoconium aciculare CBS 342.82 TaxID=1314786 RepID=A0A6J3MIN0_9PEZI|nr:uncharacterized protein K489DRAFT_349397 [Dissoconium aciculare CBS 342.82]KAF1827763.1 hypothetical protein K489DRAFT_349397 [Dissoconium aciculare CBS 342.82]